MSDFIESEAEESSEEEQTEEMRAKQKKPRSAAQIHSDSEEEEDDDEKLAEEMKDLINDDEEEEEGSSGSSSGSSSSGESGEESGAEEGGDSHKEKKHKRKHDDYDDNIDDDDFDLIEENLGIKVERKKKLKRVKVLDEDEEDEKEKDKDELAQELFEDGDEDMMEDAAASRSERDTSRHPEGAHRPQEEDLGSESGSEDDVNDFIVDDDGQPITKAKKKRHVKYSDSALQEAQDIFGVDFDYEDVRGYDDEFEGSEEDEEYEDEEEQEPGARPTKSAKPGGKKAAAKKSIFEVFEPIELEQGHFTDRDQEIRTTDEPERFQLRGVPVTAADETELAEEAEWIFRQCFQKPTISVQKPPLGSDPSDSSERSSSGHQPLGGKKSRTAVAKICETLKFMRNQHFEVPFIAFYRKEYVQPELTINDLWLIYKWDERWCHLRQQKLNMEKLFKKMQEYICEQILNDDSAADNLRQIEEADFERLREVQSSEELKDVYLHFLLYYAQDLPAMQEAVMNKRKQKREDARRRKLERQKEKAARGAEEVCRELGLHGLAKKFGLTPQQFGENLRDNYQRHEVVQFPVQPLEAATEYVNDRLKSPPEALKAARYMVACEIARDPTVRRCVRETFFERAKLSVVPTKTGVKEIDESHPCYAFKYLKNKPVRSLQGDQFLKLKMAENDKLIRISIRMDGEGTVDSGSYAHDVRQLYHRDEFSKNVQEWNGQREEALNYALSRLLYPTLEKELKLRLLREAYDHVLRACTNKLYNWLKIAPYEPPDEVQEEEDFDTREGVKILAIAYQNDWNTPAFGALISGEGEVTDYLRLENILKRRNARREQERDAKQRDMEKLKRFLSDKKPHCVVIGAESREALGVKEDVEQAIRELAEEEQFPPLQVMLLDNELAMVYATSKRAEQDFAQYPPLLKQAVSLARRMQDPLIEFSQLCGHDEEILCLKYHPLQDNVPKEEFEWVLAMELINRTNEVGVDINRCVEQSHTAGMLQFVSGLGPRKAYAVIKALKQTHSKLEGRSNLVTSLKLGPKVFLNCAGFIRIDTNSFESSSSTYVEVLDGSRVHPEMYEWARKMATDALDYDDNDEATLNPAEALEEILDNPDKLKDLDLDAFAVELERQGYGNKGITLYDIRAELNHRYKDLRVDYTPPEKEVLFNLLTKETPETFYLGKLVTCQVSGIARKRPQGDQLDQANPIRNDESGLWQCPFCLKNDFPELSEVWNHFDAGNCPGPAMGVKVRFDNGITGFIPTKNLSDKRVANPEERVRVGQIIHGRVTKIDIARFAVELTTKTSDLADKNGEMKPSKDLYYDHEADDKERRKADDVQKHKQRQVYVKRVIVHPSFHNIGYQEAVKLLSTMDQGEIVIRPSSKGVDHLTVTWKVHGNILQHIDVQEKGKENSFSLGSSLIINGEEFECLDEIIARHVQPMAGFAKDITSFKYFFEFEGGKKEHAEKWLADEKRKAPAKIPYCISAAESMPGRFLLSYQPNTKPRHEFVTISPDGFRYRNQMFHSLNALFRWFKEHFRDPIPAGGSSASAVTPGAASTHPYMTPGLATPGRMSAVPMVIATPGLATPGARTPASIATASYAAAYSAAGAGYGTAPAAGYGGMTPQPMQISTTPGYVTPGQSYGAGSSYGTSMPPLAAPSSSYHRNSQTSARSHHGSPSPSPRPSPRTHPSTGSSRGPGGRDQHSTSMTMPGVGRSAEDWKKMAAEWASGKTRNQGGPRRD
ncbi:transcription elongation factor SPT6 [Tropilaelaps mercedesae]|uniref:Suppressor of Ty 6 homolog n=1 Tax=Tropilaelaps mercedesae TaxID=418985 RepID=A0A1V9XC49_9ACAR|nr:transcription elongation factor SPT6 [Tropilaelaps mercedesae]